MELSNFDYIVVAVLGISLLIGFMRGFMKEFLGLLSWIAAGLAMVYLTPVIIDKFFKDTSAVMQVSMGIAIAIIVLIIMAFIVYAITNKVRTSPLNALDRLLGLVFGLARGAILIMGTYILLGVITPDVQKSLFDKKENVVAGCFIEAVSFLEEQFPHIFEVLKDAKEETAEQIKDKTDSVVEESKEEILKKLNSPISEAPKKAKKKEKTYSKNERNALDKLVSSHTDD